jgi:hypothetical protein
MRQVLEILLKLVLVYVNENGFVPGQNVHDRTKLGLGYRWYAVSGMQLSL